MAKQKIIKEENLQRIRRFDSLVTQARSTLQRNFDKLANSFPTELSNWEIKLNEHRGAFEWTVRTRIDREISTHKQELLYNTEEWLFVELDCYIKYKQYPTDTPIKCIYHRDNPTNIKFVIGPELLKEMHHINEIVKATGEEGKQVSSRIDDITLVEDSAVYKESLRALSTLGIEKAYADPLIKKILLKYPGAKTEIVVQKSLSKEFNS